MEESAFFQVRLEMGSSEPLEHLPYVAKLFLERPANNDDINQAQQADFMSKATPDVARALQEPEGMTVNSQPLVGFERCVLFVGVHDHFQIVILQTQGQKPFGSGERIKGVVDPLEREAILFCDVTQLPVVHAETNISLLLTDQHDGRRPKTV
jgi:hypothetical protein